MAAHRSESIDALYRNSKTVWPGMVIGWIGNPDHASGVSGHNPDDTPGVSAELTDADKDPEVRSLDWMIGPKFTTADARKLVSALTTGVDRSRLYYVIYDRKIYSRPDFKPKPYGGSDPHTNHVHGSGWVGDDANGADWTSVLSLGEEPDVDVFYKIQSTDPEWNNQVWVSNRIHRRKLRNPGNIQTPAKAGATQVILTDTLRGTEKWDSYLLAVAGPEFPALVCTCNCDCADAQAHTHDVSTAVPIEE